MSLLHVYDASDGAIRQTASARGAANQLAVDNGNGLEAALDNEIRAGRSYQRILFETHGSPGQIYFGNVGINSAYWQARVGRWTQLVTSDARIYFNGCNVAETPCGWSFLEAAVGTFMRPGGGEMFGQTSVGFGNPFNGHVVHFWGSTRKLFVNREGRVVERFEQ